MAIFIKTNDLLLDKTKKFEFYFKNADWLKVAVKKIVRFIQEFTHLIFYVKNDQKTYFRCSIRVVVCDIQFTLQSVYPFLLQMAIEKRP